jgi:aldehyde:ferredoxin oxidoreductase
MTTPGFAGKILHVDLTNKKINIIDSSKYEEFGGGYGTAIALFWDLCVAPGNWDLQDAFDPRNIVSLMTGPLAGTGIPFAGRTSVSGLSPESWPVDWFSRSNFGGNFASMLKFAGWDGVVVQGRSESPVYINIIDDKVTIEDASKLWGLDTWKAQEEIIKLQNAETSAKGNTWRKLGNNYSLQKPSIVVTGPAGENLSRIGSLIHGGGSGAGQGGFGGVFGSKNLKAISVVGTGSIKVADPKGLREARKWFEKTWPGFQFGPRRSMASCAGCTRGCRMRTPSYGKDSDGCAESTWYDLHSPPWTPTNFFDKFKATDIVQKLGINAYDSCFGGAMVFVTPGHPIQPAVPEATGIGWYIKQLYDRGIIGPGKKIDTHPLPMDKYDKVEFAEAFGNAIANREGIGDLLADGVVRFAEKIGRLEDLNDIWRCPAWGYVDHWTMPGVEWAYGNLMDSRDINNHDMQVRPSQQPYYYMPCTEYVEIMTEATPPYNDPFMFDYSWDNEQAYKTGIYSDHKAKLVAWHQHYQTYYKESILFCDWGFGNYINIMTRDKKGYTPQAEPVFINAVTGKNMTFVDGMETGKKAWLLRRAILAMQGRHRDVEKFAGYMYRPGASAARFGGSLPVYNGKKWNWDPCGNMYLDENGVETWKTAYYNLEGWDPKTGYPKRKTLEDQGMEHVANVLQANKRLGSA